jgi:diguanylate cyclase (GGDEF)-like protein
MKILIADDDAIARRLLEATLVRLGHDVVMATDGVEARDRLLEPDSPRLAILDWMMPGLDGPSVCRAVRDRTPFYLYLMLLTSRDRREDMVSGLGAGADDFLTKPLDFFMLQARIRTGERIVQLQDRLLTVQDALRHQATHDQLTAIWNRRRVLEQLDLEVTQARRRRAPLSVTVLDIDHFKTINDTHGHQAGDAVLRDIALRIRGALRAGDSVGRYGGEEFLVLMPDCGPGDGVEVAERIRSAVSLTPVALDGGDPVDVTLSAGIASSDGTDCDADTLVREADLALYQAKALGRNRVETHVIA